ncbi:MAG: TrkA family potassium uptake protein [Phycisphaerales bacterium]
MNHRSAITSTMPWNWDPIVRRSLTMCAIVVMLGTAGYTWIEGWTAWESLFFTLVTLTTVGYGDYGLSSAGERFTAIVMIGGIGTVSYAASQFITHAATRAIQPERRMLSKAAHLTDHHIVCGLGRTGQHIINRLHDEHVPLVAIDLDEIAVKETRNHNHIALQGDATHDEVLISAGIEHAKTIAVVTSCDAANAMICLSARALAPGAIIIARAEEDASVQKLKRAGATHVISPTRYSGDSITESMLRPDIASMLYGIDNAATGSLKFTELVITQDSPHHNKSIADLGKANPKLVFVASRSPQGELNMRPGPTETLRDGQVLIIAGTNEDVEALSTQLARAA